MSDPIIVITRAKIRAGARAEFVAAARECIAATRREHGCLAYDIHESLTEPGQFVSLEGWETRLDVDRHMQQPHLLAFLAVAGTCAEAPPVVEVVESRSVDRL